MLKKYKIDGNKQKDWNSQAELVVPQKAPQVVSIPKQDGTGNYVMQRKVGEETKKYAAPEHYPRKSKHFGHPEEFERKLDEWMAKSQKPKTKGRVIEQKSLFGHKLDRVRIHKYKEGK